MSIIFGTKVAITYRQIDKYIGIIFCLINETIKYPIIKIVIALCIFIATIAHIIAYSHRFLSIKEQATNAAPNATPSRI